MCYNMLINKEYDMTANKVTVTIPNELKEQLISLKRDLKLSMSAIYKEALEAYLEKKEIEKWENGAKLASKNKEYLRLCKDLGNKGTELYEY
jgi:post-segregation antitoxin (ccd killing protein)